MFGTANGNPIIFLASIAGPGLNVLQQEMSGPAASEGNLYKICGLNGLAKRFTAGKSYTVKYLLSTLWLFILFFLLYHGL